MGIYERRKGLNFERQVAVKLRAAFPLARRHLEFQKIEADGVDITGCDDFKIQCKKYKRYASLSSIQEIQCTPELGEIPVLVTAGDNLPALACLPFEDFVRIVKEWKELKQWREG